MHQVPLVSLKLPLTLLVLLMSALPIAAQTAPAKRNMRDGVYTAAQADRGQLVFKEVCETCHAPRYFTGRFLSTYATMWDMFDFTRYNMPEDNPASLSDQKYIDLMAYILKVNNVPPGEKELPVERAPLDAITLAPQPLP